MSTTLKTHPIPEEFFNEAGEIIYPDSDGQPMADNTKQFEWIATIKGNLDSIFAQHTDVFVAGDLLWYPVEGAPHIRVAPDVMVAFGRPKGHRGSYQQWKEENIAPQVVFEILSPGNSMSEMLRKREFYMRHGVQEYYVYDPDSNIFLIYTREGELLQENLGLLEWHSPLLDVRFELEEDTLKVYDPQGKPFLTYVERFEAEKAAQEREKAAQEELKKAQKEEAKALSEKESEIARLKELLRQSGYGEK